MTGDRIIVDTTDALAAIATLRGGLKALTPTYSWRGPQYRGAMRDRRAAKRTEAEYRNARTPPERRRAARRSTP